jgi:hypothetical protein
MWTDGWTLRCVSSIQRAHNNNNISYWLFFNFFESTSYLEKSTLPKKIPVCSTYGGFSSYCMLEKESNDAVTIYVSMWWSRILTDIQLVDPNVEH